MRKTNAPRDDVIAGLDSKTVVADAETLDVIAFDAYGTLFDVAGEDWAAPEVVQTFRAKQLQYTWLVSMMATYRDFDDISRAAVEYCAAAHGVTLDVDSVLERQRRIRAFPEVATVLRRVGAARSRRLAIVSNGRPESLAALVANNGLGQTFASIVSVHPLRTYKPAPEVYRHALDELGAVRERLLFVSSNSWDAFGAAQFGLRTAWVNRAGVPGEGVGGRPEIVVRDLTELAEALGD
jgi:2-haloacid dehalogenase